MKKFVLCMTGVEKQYMERDFIKFMRKHMENQKSLGELPVHSVHKKRGKAFAFLNFKDDE